MENNSKSWQCVLSEKGPDLKLFKARFDHMQNPRNDKTERMIILESDDAVNVVAITSKQQMVFVRQYRFGIGYATLELPGGIIDQGEEVELAAKRELEEETGFGLGNWKKLGKIPSNPVFMDSYIYHYLAQDIEAVGTQQLDDGEDVEVVLLSVEEVFQLFKQNSFQHPHTVNALVRYFVYTQKI